MGQDSSTHFLVGVDFHRLILVGPIVNLGLALEDDLNNLFLTSGQDVSILRIDPSLFVLLINESGAKIMSVKDQSFMSKVMDMVPDLINRFSGKKANTDIGPDFETED